MDPYKIYDGKEWKIGRKIVQVLSIIGQHQGGQFEQ